ncbi:MAG: metalloregulator ArsR/SmtB family transcription factor [Spirochaetia bacterium]|jgi:ArsR family transcriptional regulator, lead/cadmium/zinc/bismuth-responsive transcriptional repressor|nr:metalloregulator ArsR/SmtB family transcription factor [Spirochaetia bacterium]
MDEPILPVEEEVCDLADFFKTFGDTTRLRILFQLLQGEQHVQALTDAIGLQQAAVSHQLSTLRLLRLVAYRKEGRKVYYSLNDQHIAQILQIGMQHVQEAQR